MRVLAAAVVVLILAPLSATEPSAPAPPSQDAPSSPCGPAGFAHVRTTLYLGLTRQTGAISENEWRAFLREHVTPRFPDGLTVVEAQGHWRRADGRISRERSKVLLLVHDDTPLARATLGEIVATYKRLFEQESVLWESSQVCATF